MRESFRPGDTVQVDFPFTNAIGTARRPGLVLIDTGDDDVVVARITSRRVRDEFDVEINDWNLAGLRSPSIVRTHKLTTIEKGLVEQHLGTLSGSDWARVREVVERLWLHRQDE
jgi:mRNA interferase MazF